MKRSQAALEFLVTYAWAFTAIMITIGALYYFGIFDFSKFLPEKCIFTSQLECLNFVMKDTGEIRLMLVNNLGEKITVESMTIKNDANPTLSCTEPTASAPITGWEAGNEHEFIFLDCSGGGYLKKERVEAKVKLTYFSENTPSQPRHTVNGKIQGRVS
ncbi:MAG: hypothetical protein IH934_08130 [Nanoarchaeota archaeon]|nr:hypothetical protein [Nanoarchaeota archaeon]